MKIGIQTWGTEGDVRPFLALAGGLSQAGHDVKLVISEITGKNFSAFEDRLGIKIQQVGTFFGGESLLKRRGAEVLFTRDLLKQIRKLFQYFFEPLVPDLYDAATELCLENDMVIGHFLVHPLAAAAEKAGLPRVSVFTTPMHPSKYYMGAGGPNLGVFFNSLAWMLAKIMVNQVFGPDINRLRKQEGLAPVCRVIQDVWSSPLLNLLEVSPALMPKPADWPDNLHVTGFFNLPQTAETQDMPDALQRFIDTGPPPVYITFGSMTDAEIHPEKIIGLLMDAVRLAGCRAILQFKKTDAPQPADDPRLFWINRAPHGLVFPHCAAIVHHGGSGTTQAACLAGRPSVIVAHATDQPFWAARLHGLGIGARPLHRLTVTAPKLAKAIEKALATPERRAREIGRQMAREDGVRAGVGLIEEM